MHFIISQKKFFFLDFVFHKVRLSQCPKYKLGAHRTTQEAGFTAANRGLTQSFPASRGDTECGAESQEAEATPLPRWRPSRGR